MFMTNEFLMSRSLPFAGSNDDITQGNCDFEIEWRADEDAFTKLWPVPSNAFKGRFAAQVSPDELSTRQAVLVNRQRGCNNFVVGVGMAWKNFNASGEEVGWLDSVAIAKDKRGCGLGRLLVAALLDRLHELGHREVYLLVHADNLAAVSLYLSFGFEAVLEDADEVAQWQILEVAAHDSYATSILKREAEAVPHISDSGAASLQGDTVVEAISRNDWWAEALRVRSATLSHNPDEFFTEASKCFAICGPAAIIYASALVSGRGFETPLTLQEASAQSLPPHSTFESTFQRFCHKRTLLAAQSKRQGTAVAIADLQQLEHGHSTLESFEETSQETAALCALCDLHLCWHLVDQLQFADPNIFTQQETFSSRFCNLPSLIQISFSPVAGGDLCCTPQAIEWMLTKTCGLMVRASTWVHDSTTLEECLLLSAADKMSEGIQSISRSVLLVGKSCDECSPGKKCCGGFDTEVDPVLDLCLDHWFVISDVIENAGTNMGSAEPRRFSSDAWNFTGNGGAKIPLGAPTGLTAEVLRDELSITYVLVAYTCR